MNLQTDWLFKLAIRKQERRTKEKRPGAPPDAVRDKQDEGAALLRRAREARANAMAKALAEHKPFARFVKTLQVQEPECTALVAGVLDVDLAELAVRLNVDELPPAVKFLAVEEVHALVQRVNKRDHGHEHDEIPWCLPAGIKFTLQELKEAIGVL